ncbi:MAG: S8 family serine peptidase [Clostridia bacterium]|nr:S8 family serine peptidase [Clostridia bacterium]
MKKVLSVFLAFAMCVGLFCLCMPALAAKAQASEKTTLIVEFSDETALNNADGVYAQTAARKNAVQEVRAAASGAKPVYTYTHVLNGCAIEASKGDAEALRQLDCVQAVYDVGSVKAAVEELPQGALISSGPMIGVDALHEMGLDGTGTAIAVIDGGLQWDHAVMRLSDPASAKYTKAGIDAVLKNNVMNCADVSADDLYKSEKVPFAFDYCEGDTDVNDYNNGEPDHGTHVSGIAAGNGSKLVGVAPEAQVLMFKIDVYDDEVFLANLLAAIDDAAKFDIASMNMSVGMDFEMRTDPAHELLGKAITNARNSGITVCTAAGNAGVSSDDVLNPDNGTNGIPNSFADSTSVASVDNVNLSEPIVFDITAVRYDGEKQAQVDAVSSFDFPKSGEYVPVGRKGFPGSSEGKVALVYDPNANVSRYLVGENWLGVIMSESALELLFMKMYEDMMDMRLLIVSDVDAYRMLHAGTKTFELVYETYYIEPADLLRYSEFTSFGVSEDLELTVDAAAPGGIIYSSVTDGQYDVYDGTSMASPHIAGSAALLEQYIAKTNPGVSGRQKADLKESLLCSTADPVTAQDVPISPRAVGAGLANLREAVSAKAVLLGKGGNTALNLGDKIDDTFKLTFTVQNVSKDTVRYDTLDLDVITDDYEIYKEFDDQTGKYSYGSRITGLSVPLRYSIVQSDMPRSIVLQSGESRTVNVTVQLDAQQLTENAEVFSNGFYVEGYLYLTDSMSGNTPLNIPFMGFRGDWTAIPAVTFGDAYFNYFGMRYLIGTGYSVNRNLKSLSFILLDENGKACAVHTEEYVKKGTIYEEWLLPELFDDTEDLQDGTYTLVVRGETVFEGAAPIELANGLCITIDRTWPRILSVKTKRDSGSSTVTITCDCDDVDYFELRGATLLDMNFYDLIPVDGYDETDADGNYVYVLHTDTVVRGRLLVNATDFSGNQTEWGRMSVMLRIVNFFKSLPDRISEWFWMKVLDF